MEEDFSKHADAQSVLLPNNKSVGVFVGLSNNDWMRNRSSDTSDNFGDTCDAFESMNTASAAAANRISYVFGLTGPSMVIDTACSSSLVALHQAYLALMNNDCEYAIVGGADLLISKHNIEVCLLVLVTVRVVCM